MANKSVWSVFLLLILLIPPVLYASAGEQQPLTPKQRNEIVNKISALVEENYVFPEVGRQCANHIQNLMNAGQFDQITGLPEFTSRLTAELQSISKDKHMNVEVLPERQAPGEKPSPFVSSFLFRQNMKSKNYGFVKAEILDGNVGYLDVRGFVPLPEGRETVAAAMHFLQNTDALIIDLRRNNGGSPDIVQYLCSYFFDERVHLNSIYSRRNNHTEEFWTLDNVEGKKRPDLPLFVLTSQRTFSAGEEFAYNLQTRKRAVLIGEVTGGGANPGRMFPVQGRVGVFIPLSRAINPITGTNWEGVGVHPDVEISADEAFNIALEKAVPMAEEFRQNQKQKMLTLVREFEQAVEHSKSLFKEGRGADAESLIHQNLTQLTAYEIMDEVSINMLGYDYLTQNRFSLAIAVFKFNVQAYPESYNVYDSLGEAYMKSGNRELAIQNYQISLKMNPENQNARQMLEQLKN